MTIPPGARAVPAYYRSAELWSADSLARREALRPRIEAWRAARGGRAGARG